MAALSQEVIGPRASKQALGNGSGNGGMASCIERGTASLDGACPSLFAFDGGVGWRNDSAALSRSETIIFYVLSTAREKGSRVSSVLG